MWNMHAGSDIYNQCYCACNVNIDVVYCSWSLSSDCGGSWVPSDENIEHKQSLPS